MEQVHQWVVDKCKPNKVFLKLPRIARHEDGKLIQIQLQCLSI